VSPAARRARASRAVLRQAGAPQPSPVEAVASVEAQRVLPAGQWLRVVMGFEAPFGFDGMPTVWG